MSISAFLRERRRLFLLFLQQVGAGRLAMRLENLGKQTKNLPGWMIDTGGCKLHVVVVGPAVAPTVVFEAGSGGWSTDWSEAQQEIAAFARAVSYDRAGHGWSEPARRHRTLLHMVEELHAVLYNTGVKPPFVLVGRDFGALLAAYFTRFYPEETAGLVLVGELDLEEIVSEAEHQELPRLADPVRVKMMRKSAFLTAIKDQNKRIREAGADGLQKQLDRAGPLPDVPIVRLRSDASDQEIVSAIKDQYFPT